LYVIIIIIILACEYQSMSCIITMVDKEVN